MSKTKTQFVCQSCGYMSPRWIGKCPECNTWNSFVEETSTVSHESSRALGARASQRNGEAIHPIRISEIDTSTEHRITTGIAEFDRTLGGGIMPGSIVLVGGDRPVPRQRIEFIFVTLIGFCRWISGREVHPLAIELPYPAPVDSAPYRAAFHCPVTFDAPRNSLLISHADATAPLPTFNPVPAELRGLSI